MLQGQHFSDLIQKVPNLNYAGGTSRPRYFQIRGEGSVSRYADQGPPSPYVGIVLDGIDIVSLYRKQFASLVKNNNNDLSKAIDSWDIEEDSLNLDD